MPTATGGVHPGNTGVKKSSSGSKTAGGKTQGPPRGGTGNQGGQGVHPGNSAVSKSSTGARTASAGQPGKLDSNKDKYTVARAPPVAEALTRAYFEALTSPLHALLGLAVEGDQRQFEAVGPRTTPTDPSSLNPNRPMPADRNLSDILGISSRAAAGKATADLGTQDAGLPLGRVRGGNSRGPGIDAPPDTAPPATAAPVIATPATVLPNTKKRLVGSGRRGARLMLF